MYKVCNCCELTKKYVVVRECNNSYWYYTQTDNLVKASNVITKEIHNAFIVEKELVESVK